MKSNQMKGSTIILLIFEFQKTCFPMHIRHSIRKTGDVGMIHRAIPCRYRIHLDNEETESFLEALHPFDNGATTKHYEDWILPRWSHHGTFENLCSFWVFSVPSGVTFKYLDWSRQSIYKQYVSKTGFSTGS